jgi:hypothetical protein
MKSEQEQNNTSPATSTENMKAVTELLGMTETPETAAPKEEIDTGDSSLSDALQAETAEHAEVDSDESQETIKAPPKNLKELAEQLEVEVADLYALEFPAAEDGESHTLGELKDMLATQSDFTGRELELSERKVAFDSEQMQARQELETILKAIPPEALDPAVLQRAKQERAMYLEREGEKLLQTVPEWQDAEVRQSEMQGIAKHMQDYGFSDGQLDQMIDHRMLRYMRDNLNRKNLVENALSRVKSVNNPPKGKARRPQVKAAPPRVTPSSSLNDQVSAIDSLLNL